MKKIYFVPVIVLFLLSSCAPKIQYLTTSPDLPLNQVVMDTKNEKDRTNLLGISNREGLQVAPFKEWYDKYYDEYKPNPTAISKAKKKFKGVEVLAFMGTWCGDSKRGVPQFYKTMDAMGFDEKSLKLVCVSDLDPTYKQSPNREEKDLNIHRVPTFIFYKNGKEIGRIVEKPSTSFEVDVAQIVNDLAPTPNYPTQQLIRQHLKEKGIAEMEKKLKPYGRYVARNTTSSSELNTYGYVLFSAGKTEEAIFVFRINSKAYPKKANVFSNLGEAYARTGKKDLAIENYKKVLEIDPDHKSAKEELEKLGVTDWSLK